MNIARLARLTLRANKSIPNINTRIHSPRIPIASAAYIPHRTFTASTSFQRAQSTPPPTAPKTKPQTLRRAAQASLPIRSNPTPTRGSIQPVLTLATAESYDPHILRGPGVLPPGSQRVHAAWWIPSWREYGEVWVFDSGSCVFWGLSEAEARMFVAEVLMRVKGIEKGRLKAMELEELEFVTDPNETTRLQGDLIILGQMPPIEELEFPSPSSTPTALPTSTLPARYAFSHALARSSALSALETSLDSYLSSVSKLPLSLSKTGKPGLGRKELRMKLGQLMRFRQGVNLGRESFGDTPDVYWTEPVLEGYFDSVSEALEIKGRADSVNEKITYAAELQGLLRELLAESSGHRMELIIIALIAVEVVIAIIRDGPEMWHMFTGKPEVAQDKGKELELVKH
ncbi:hypothetical protein FRC12_000607 [Ceratobasidium sp. 428]|nr:hypothetical protein FRC12_000607 [Ceratobasidium sp. 428]